MNERKVEKFRDPTPQEWKAMKEYRKFMLEEGIEASYWFTIHTTEEGIMIAGREDCSPFFSSQFIENFVEDI